MAMSFTAQQQAKLNAGLLMLRYFMYVEAKDAEGDPAPAGFWNDVFAVEVDGKTYHGAGGIIEVGTLRASADGTIEPLTITLNYANDEVVNTLRGFIRGQEPITVYVGLFDPATRQLEPPLIRWFKGKIDDIDWPTPPLNEDSVIKVICESSARALTIKRTETRSDECMKRRKANDKFFQYSAVQPEIRLWFGKEVSSGKTQSVSTLANAVAAKISFPQ